MGQLTGSVYKYRFVSKGLTMTTMFAVWLTWIAKFFRYATGEPNPELIMGI